MANRGGQQVMALWWQAAHPTFYIRLSVIMPACLSTGCEAREAVLLIRCCRADADDTHETPRAAR